MTIKEKYNFRVEKGLCPRCGSERDSDKKYCSNCLKYYKERREKSLLLGICPVCGKNRIHENEKMCFECYEKHRESLAKQKDKRNDREKQYRAKRKERSIALGLCTCCGKRKAVYGFKMCPMCRMKKRNYMRVRAVVNG